jgi:hypothetical protein
MLTQVDSEIELVEVKQTKNLGVYETSFVPECTFA